MKIPMAKPDLNGNSLKYLEECITTGWVSSSGAFIKKFEDAFANFCGTKFATSCSNGTTALHLALLAIDIKEGDEIIVPNITFAATAAAVVYCNAKPVLVDVNKKTWNIDVEEIKKKITSKTKAIIPVHLYGNPCDMNEIMKIAKEKNLFVIEDAAESHGAEYKGKKVGSIGHIGCFSFFGNKIITTGEGGMCVTNDEKLLNRMNLFKNHGMEKKYWHDVIGYNYRMTNLQASLGLAQLERIREFIQERKRIAKKYIESLKGKTGVTFQETMEGGEAVNWFFSILVENRDQLVEKLSKKGIDSRNVFYPLNEMEPYKDNSNFPNSKLISKQGISLPTFVELKDEEIEQICSLIK